VATNILTNVPCGIIPAATDVIQQELDISST